MSWLSVERNLCVLYAQKKARDKCRRGESQAECFRSAVVCGRFSFHTPILPHQRHSTPLRLRLRRAGFIRGVFDQESPACGASFEVALSASAAAPVRNAP